MTNNSECQHTKIVGSYCNECGAQVWPLIDGFGKAIPMKNNDKADQLHQNIKSTCSKLQQEMEDKPYIRPGQKKIWNSLADLKVLLSEDNKQTDDDLTWDIE